MFTDNVAKVYGVQIRNDEGNSALESQLLSYMTNSNSRNTKIDKLLGGVISASEFAKLSAEDKSAYIKKLMAAAAALNADDFQTLKNQLKDQVNEYLKILG